MSHREKGRAGIVKLHSCENSRALGCVAKAKHDFFVGPHNLRIQRAIIARDIRGSAKG